MPAQTHRRVAATATVTAASAALAALPARTAAAHHPMEGATPDTWWEGLLSGFGHPIIEPVHLAFIALIALLCLGLKRPLPPAGLFVAGTAAGALAHWVGAPVPAAAFLTPLSVVLAGLALAYGRLPARGDVVAGLFLVAGTVHGTGYGETIVGAEASPVGFYLAGFAVTQLALVAAIQVAAGWLQGRFGPAVRTLGRPIAGSLGVVAGLGLLAQAGLGS